MATVQRLPPGALCLRIDAGEFGFETTAQLEDLSQVIGQARAMDAIRFGIGIRHLGYNLFVLGPPGTGRHTIVHQVLEQRAKQEPDAPDWCYVSNFEQAHKPRVLRLPAGMGVTLRDDMQQLMDDLRSAIPAAFESDEYRARREEIEEELKERHEKAFEELRKRAEKNSVALIRTPTGMSFAPTRKGEVMSSDDFHKLPEQEQQRIEAAVASLQEGLEGIIHQLPQWKRESLRRARELDREVTKAAVTHLMGELRKKYAAHSQVQAYLEAVEQSVIDNADDFRHQEEGQEMTFLGVPVSRAAGSAATLRRYKVNVLVDRGGARGAPVVYENNPSLQNLVGRIEHLAQMGALLTDFTLIKPGALHSANGGYLILDAHKLLLQPYAWEALKRALKSRQLRIESLEQLLSIISTVSLEPEPIELDVKVVLIGERMLYYLLYQYDPEFIELFKVAADFHDDMERSPESHLLYARLIATLARKEGLLALDRAAVARVIEYGVRLADAADKLSIRTRDIADILRESDHWARDNGRDIVSGPDVQQAIDAKIYRSDRLRERLQEEIRRGTLLIETQSAVTGQVNGLSVVDHGEFAFGHPSRISARVRLGKGEVIDIQREIDLGGPIHSKGVLTLGGFLGGRYAIDRPLALSASLVFEQTYGQVEGDSASSAELYALLSALAEVPIKQSLAVTGSVDQYGRIQAIGGVNEKIEGFFDVCSHRDLTGEQGVLIPAANVKHLMLRRDVIEACAAGKFHIYPVTTIDEGIELLTGMPAGERDANGLFPDGTVNQRVEVRLMVMAEQARSYSAAFEGGGGG
ncbi:MAG: ATP-dependent protease [Candidatus Muproteobacteria bacterium RBG_16_64_11]|uniref:endopeptidase La n=1 Tax=Candidatus Muproteobacteria bacterium RBG_16_64_11 TaxID=1817758 RepID=A0A1F6TEB1_9PROT|nr:MAG: ATP-dependent protease [Candidatus Muproteobacteria bacterium RBG_16_64_11]